MLNENSDSKSYILFTYNTWEHVQKSIFLAAFPPKILQGGRTSNIHHACEVLVSWFQLFCHPWENQAVLQLYFINENKKLNGTPEILILFLNSMQRKGKTELFYLLVHSPMAKTTEAVLPGLPHGCQVPSTWSVFCSFARHTNRELHQK